VFDEYGLIVCGWSADWDTALRQAIERCPTRRFGVVLGHVRRARRGGTATCCSTRATTVRITDADGLFEDLLDRVKSLEQMAVTDPVSTKVAVARMKRKLPWTP